MKAGSNNFRDSVPGGDDQVVGNDISTGANGICETTAKTGNLVPTNVPSAAALQAYLNDVVWGKQANVFFTVTRVDKIVNYDSNRDGKLNVVSGSLAGERGVIVSEAQDKNVDINVYYMNVYDLADANASTLGQQSFIGDSHVNFAVNITAHEIGHTLGITYESNDSIDIMLSFSSASNPCNVKMKDWNTINP